MEFTKEELATEEWRDVIGFEGLYQVSNLGRIYSVRRYNKGRIFGDRIKQVSKDFRNRYTVQLNKNGKTINIVLARLVAKAFVENPNPAIFTEVNHLDENPANNAADNLEWCTHKYNCNYGTRMERIKQKQNIPILQYTLDGDFIAEFASMHLAAKSINAETGHICDCCLGNRSYAYGYIWRYKDNDKHLIAKERLNAKIEKGKKSRADKFTEKALNVVQLDKDGKYIQTFKSTKLAAESIGSHRPMIINCCNGKIRQVKGFRFMYERDYLFLQANEKEQMTLF